MKQLMSIIILFSLIQSASAEELSLMFTRSPEIDWTSPRTLTKSTAQSMNQSHGLGHVNVRISCGNREVLTGNSTRWGKQTRTVVMKEGYGLGVLFNLFEGYLDNPKYIIPSFQKLAKDNRTNFVTFKVSPSTCQRLLEYHDQYHLLMKTRQGIQRASQQNANHEQQIFYGFPAIARYGEGGGCSGFAISFLEVAGIKEQWMVDEWSQEVLIPQTTVGRPMRPYHVGFRSLYTSSPKRWAHASEPHFPLFFWDPDMMFKSVVKRAQNGQHEVASLYGVSGIRFDRTMIPTPTEPLFLNDPHNSPSDPRLIYNDLKELKRRYEVSKQISSIVDPAEAVGPCLPSSDCAQFQ